MLLSLILSIPKPVPGVVIDHRLASSQVYVGSPSLAILPNGDYVAAHDDFGPRATKTRFTSLFRSTDRGQTWSRLPSVPDAAWSGLFVYRGALYLMGPNRGYGDFRIRRSDDGGATWTPPSILLDGTGYHTAPTPVVEAKGRLWRAFEHRPGTKGWAPTFQAGVLSAPIDANLMDPSQWTATNLLASDRKWNGGDMGGWLEGNAVVSPEGSLVDVLRIDTRSSNEKAAVVRVSDDGKAATFDPATGFVAFPGGSKKFTIRFDPKSRLYWSLASIVLPQFQKRRPAYVRNTLALTSSPDLVHWDVRRIVETSKDVRRTGFHYVDWLFDGDDLVAVVRTAFDGAHSAHDANYLTFRRIEDFRDLP